MPLNILASWKETWRRNSNLRHARALIRFTFKLKTGMNDEDLIYIAAGAIAEAEMYGQELPSALASAIDVLVSDGDVKPDWL